MDPRIFKPRLICLFVVCYCWTGAKHSTDLRFLIGNLLLLCPHINIWLGWRRLFYDYAPVVVYELNYETNVQTRRDRRPPLISFLTPPQRQLNSVPMNFIAAMQIIYECPLECYECRYFGPIERFRLLFVPSVWCPINWARAWSGRRRNILRFFGSTMVRGGTFSGGESETAPEFRYAVNYLIKFGAGLLIN